MKKIILSTLLLFACFATTMAQQAKIGLFSYDAVLKAMPDYSIAMANIDSLRKQYAEEIKSAEDEFSEKYELFLDQQTTLADAIRQKRQADLQALLERNTAFKEEADRLLEKAQQDAIAPIKEKIQAAIKATGEKEQLFVILNTDSEACPYIAPAFAVDVTESIIEQAKR